MAQTPDLNTVVVVGGNLFEIAAVHLGSAMQWINIARVNKLSDPVLVGPMSLVIPQYSSIFSDGIGPQ